MPIKSPVPPEVALSICITTRNRADRLRVMLDSILSQSERDYEIVILDGASTDETGELVAEYRRSNSQIKYYREEVNTGIDSGIDQAAGLSAGRYCWLLSDDDVLKEGALSDVVSRLCDDYDLIIVNSDARVFETGEYVRPRFIEIDTDLEYGCAEIEGLFVRCGWSLTYIGSMVIRRSLWMMRDRKKYYGSYFVHVGAAFQLPLPRRSLVIAKPLVSIRHGVPSWSSRSFEILSFLWPDVVWSLPFSDHAKQSVVARRPWSRVDDLLLRRAHGQYDVGIYKRLVRPRLKTRRGKVLFSSIALTPKVLVSCCLKVGYLFVSCKRFATDLW